MLVTRKIPGRLFVLLLALWACAPDRPPGEASEDCRYLAPEAVFNEQLRGLSDYRFRREGQSATESFLLDRELRVTLRQSGCDYIQQAFLFEWEGGPRGSATRYWVRTAALHFDQLAQLGASYLSFKALSDAIRQQEGQIQLERPFELQPGLDITIIPQSDRAPKRLKVILRQE